METKHTPGPWRYDTNEFSSYLVGADGSIIAGGEPHEGYMDGKNPDERLIAAAPDLLEALEDLLHQAKFYKHEGGWDFEQARAAIAKATGETE